MPCWWSWGQTMVGGSEEDEGRSGDGEAPSYEPGADGAGHRGCEQAPGWWQGRALQGMAVPLHCFCFSPFSNEDPPALLLHTTGMCCIPQYSPRCLS